MKNTIKTLAILMVPFLISGCELVDELTGEKLKKEQVKNSHAVGSACRQAGKSIEKCYELNPKSIKSAVFDGWKEMDVYMRENKLAIQPADKNDNEETIITEEKLATSDGTQMKKPNLKLELEKNN